MDKNINLFLGLDEQTDIIDWIFQNVHNCRIPSKGGIEQIFKRIPFRMTVNTIKMMKSHFKFEEDYMIPIYNRDILVVNDYFFSKENRAIRIDDEETNFYYLLQSTHAICIGATEGVYRTRINTRIIKSLSVLSEKSTLECSVGFARQKKIIMGLINRGNLEDYFEAICRLRGLLCEIDFAICLKELGVPFLHSCTDEFGHIEIDFIIMNEAEKEEPATEKTVRKAFSALSQICREKSVGSSYNNKVLDKTEMIMIEVGSRSAGSENKINKDMIKLADFIRSLTSKEECNFEITSQGIKTEYTRSRLDICTCSIIYTPNSSIRDELMEVEHNIKYSLEDYLSRSVQLGRDKREISDEILGIIRHKDNFNLEDADFSFNLDDEHIEELCNERLDSLNVSCNTVREGYIRSSIKFNNLVSSKDKRDDIRKDYNRNLPILVDYINKINADLNEDYREVSDFGRSVLNKAENYITGCERNNLTVMLDIPTIESNANRKVDLVPLFHNKADIFIKTCLKSNIEEEDVDMIRSKKSKKTVIKKIEMDDPSDIEKQLRDSSLSSVIDMFSIIMATGRKIRLSSQHSKACNRTIHLFMRFANIDCMMDKDRGIINRKTTSSVKIYDRIEKKSFPVIISNTAFVGKIFLNNLFRNIRNRLKYETDNVEDKQKVLKLLSEARDIKRKNNILSEGWENKTLKEIYLNTSCEFVKLSIVNFAEGCNLLTRNIMLKENFEDVNNLDWLENFIFKESIFIDQIDNEDFIIKRNNKGGICIGRETESHGYTVFGLSEITRSNIDMKEDEVNIVFYLLSVLLNTTGNQIVLPTSIILEIPDYLVIKNSEAIKQLLMQEKDYVLNKASLRREENAFEKDIIEKNVISKRTKILKLVDNKFHEEDVLEFSKFKIQVPINTERSVLFNAEEIEDYLIEGINSKTYDNEISKWAKDEIQENIRYLQRYTNSIHKLLEGKEAVKYIKRSFDLCENSSNRRKRVIYNDNDNMLVAGFSHDKTKMKLWRVDENSCSKPIVMSKKMVNYLYYRPHMLFSLYIKKCQEIPRIGFDIEGTDYDRDRMYSLFKRLCHDKSTDLLREFYKIKVGKLNIDSQTRTSPEYLDVKIKVKRSLVKTLPTYQYLCDNVYNYLRCKGQLMRMDENPKINVTDFKTLILSFKKYEPHLKPIVKKRFVKVLERLNGRESIGVDYFSKIMSKSVEFIMFHFMRESNKSKNRDIKSKLDQKIQYLDSIRKSTHSLKLILKKYKNTDCLSMLLGGMNITDSSDFANDFPQYISLNLAELYLKFEIDNLATIVAGLEQDLKIFNRTKLLRSMRDNNRVDINKLIKFKLFFNYQQICNDLGSRFDNIVSSDHGSFINNQDKRIHLAHNIFERISCLTSSSSQSVDEYIQKFRFVYSHYMGIGFKSKEMGERLDVNFYRDLKGISCLLSLTLSIIIDCEIFNCIETPSGRGLPVIYDGLIKEGCCQTIDEALDPMYVCHFYNKTQENPTMSRIKCFSDVFEQVKNHYNNCQQVIKCDCSKTKNMCLFKWFNKATNQIEIKPPNRDMAVINCLLQEEVFDDISIEDEMSVCKIGTPFAMGSPKYSKMIYYHYFLNNEKKLVENYGKSQEIIGKRLSEIIKTTNIMINDHKNTVHNILQTFFESMYEELTSDKVVTNLNSKGLSSPDRKREFKHMIKSLINSSNSSNLSVKQLLDMMNLQGTRLSTLKSVADERRKDEFNSRFREFMFEIIDIVEEVYKKVGDNNKKRKRNLKALKHLDSDDEEENEIKSMNYVQEIEEEFRKGSNIFFSRKILEKVVNNDVEENCKEISVKFLTYSHIQKESYEVLIENCYNREDLVKNSIDSCLVINGEDYLKWQKSLRKTVRQHKVNNLLVCESSSIDWNRFSISFMSLKIFEESVVNFLISELNKTGYNIDNLNNSIKFLCTKKFKIYVERNLVNVMKKSSSRATVSLLGILESSADYFKREDSLIGQMFNKLYFLSVIKNPFIKMANSKAVESLVYLKESDGVIGDKICEEACKFIVKNLEELVKRKFEVADLNWNLFYRVLISIRSNFINEDTLTIGQIKNDPSAFYNLLDKDQKELMVKVIYREVFLGRDSLLDNPERKTKNFLYKGQKKTMKVLEKIDEEVSKKGDRQIIEEVMNILKDREFRICSRISSKVQIGADRDLTIMEYRTMLLQQFFELNSRIIGKGMEEFLLLNPKNVGGFSEICESVQSTSFGYNKELDNLFISGDCQKWGPKHSGRQLIKNMSILVPQRFPVITKMICLIGELWGCRLIEIQKDYEKYFIKRLLRKTRKVDVDLVQVGKNINSYVAQRGLSEINSTTRLSSILPIQDLNSTDEFIYNKFDGFSKGFCVLPVHMAQGLPHLTSSFSMILNCRFFKELILNNKMRHMMCKDIVHVGSSDDFGQIITYNKKEFNKFDYLNVLEKLSACCNIAFSQKTVASHQYGEVYSAFTARGGTSKCLLKFITGPIEMTGCGTSSDLFQQLDTSCSQILENGGSFIDTLVFHCQSIKCVRDLLSNNSRNLFDKIKKLPVIYGGCQSFEPVGSSLMNKVEKSFVDDEYDGSRNILLNDCIIEGEIEECGIIWNKPSSMITRRLIDLRKRFREKNNLKLIPGLLSVAIRYGYFKRSENKMLRILQAYSSRNIENGFQFETRSDWTKIQGSLEKGGIYLDSIPSEKLRELCSESCKSIWLYSKEYLEFKETKIISTSDYLKCIDKIYKEIRPISDINIPLYIKGYITESMRMSRVIRNTTSGIVSDSKVKDLKKSELWIKKDSLVKNNPIGLISYILDEEFFYVNRPVVIYTRGWSEELDIARKILMDETKKAEFDNLESLKYELSIGNKKAEMVLNKTVSILNFNQEKKMILRSYKNSSDYRKSISNFFETNYIRGCHLNFNLEDMEFTAESCANKVNEYISALGSIKIDDTIRSIIMTDCLLRPREELSNLSLMSRIKMESSSKYGSDIIQNIKKLIKSCRDGLSVVTLPISYKIIKSDVFVTEIQVSDGWKLTVERKVGNSIYHIDNFIALKEDVINGKTKLIRTDKEDSLYNPLENHLKRNSKSKDSKGYQITFKGPKLNKEEIYYLSTILSDELAEEFKIMNREPVLIKSYDLRRRYVEGQLVKVLGKHLQIIERPSETIVKNLQGYSKSNCYVFNEKVVWNLEGVSIESEPVTDEYMYEDVINTKISDLTKESLIDFVNDYLENESRETRDQKLKKGVKMLNAMIAEGYLKRSPSLENFLRIRYKNATYDDAMSIVSDMIRSLYISSRNKLKSKRIVFESKGYSKKVMLECLSHVSKDEEIELYPLCSVKEQLMICQSDRIFSMIKAEKESEKRSINGKSIFDYFGILRNKSILSPYVIKKIGIDIVAHRFNDLIESLSAEGKRWIRSIGYVTELSSFDLQVILGNVSDLKKIPLNMKVVGKTSLQMAKSVLEGRRLGYESYDVPDEFKGITSEKKDLSLLIDCDKGMVNEIIYNNLNIMNSMNLLLTNKLIVTREEDGLSISKIIAVLSSVRAKEKKMEMLYFEDDYQSDPPSDSESESGESIEEMIDMEYLMNLIDDESDLEDLEYE